MPGLDREPLITMIVGVLATALAAVIGWLALSVGTLNATADALPAGLQKMLGAGDPYPLPDGIVPEAWQSLFDRLDKRLQALEKKVIR